MFSVIASFSQDEAKAKKLLDEVSAKMNTYKSLYIEFRNSLDNNTEDVHQETKGNATLKGDLYSVNFLGMTTIFDGKKIYSINPEDEEINISESEDDDEFSPAQFFSFYKDGYNFSWDIVQNVNGRKIQYVKLTPINSESELKYVLLGVDSKTKHIYKLIQTGENGTDITLTITKFKTNLELPSEMFKFNRKKYEDLGYIINDL
jgi:outer membrane lipoprotein-sorting protein